MDWHPISAAGRQGQQDGPAGGGGHLPWPQPRAPRPQRVDLSLTSSIERLAGLMLGGIQVAAVQPGLRPAASGPHAAADPPGSAPSVAPTAIRLCTDISMLVQLVRLAAAAGAVLPHGLAAASPAVPATLPEHHDACRAAYADLAGVLNRLSLDDEVPPSAREDALHVLQQVDGHLQELDRTRPAPEADLAMSAHRPAREAFLPGELLG